MPNIGQQAPNIHVSRWVQGKPTNIDAERGNVVLVEVFQVNCPGCFLYGIPEVIEIHKKYKTDGLTVIGLATAFEDYDKNTVENLEKLVTTGEVIGETFHALKQYGRLLEGSKLPYKIPFRVGMDVLTKHAGSHSDEELQDFIEANVPDFRAYPEKEKNMIRERARYILSMKIYSAKTFEEYSLKGTPSTILIDRKGILRHTSFGASGTLDRLVGSLINE